MKCYYCGKADCTEHPQPECEITERALDMAELEATAKKANEEALEAIGRVGDLETDNEELRSINDMLKGELRAYEASDAVMYRQYDYHAHCQAAATLLRAMLDSGNTDTPEAWSKQADEWLVRQNTGFGLKSPVYPLPEPHRTVLALRTVIDEARRLFDGYFARQPDAPVMRQVVREWQIQADAWRDKVLVKETREALAEPFATLNQRLREAIDTNVRLSVERALNSGQIAVDSKRDSE